MSLIDWAKSHPAAAGATGLATAGAVAAGVFFSGVLPSEDPSAEPTAPVATASANPTATASSSATPTPSATESEKPSATPSATASPAPTKPSSSQKPTATASPSSSESKRDDAATLEELEGLGDGPQDPVPNENDRDIAIGFAKAYADAGGGKAEWIKGMKPFTSPEFLEGFQGIDDQWIQADKFKDVVLMDDSTYNKSYNLIFESGKVEQIQLTLAEDYQTWIVSAFS